MESELVSGFMTEHAAVIFVFFFLAEYASIVLMCIFTSVLFFGGYLINLDIFYLFDLINPVNDAAIEQYDISPVYFGVLNSTLVYGVISSLVLGIKSSIMVFVFIWVRASFPRIRFDQLMAFCWTILIPILFALIVVVPCILYAFGAFFINVSLF
jgi:NADH-ubiquinone oxidoreductase chain 1